MMAHPLALQLRNLQSLVEIGVDKNTTVVFPAPLMSTIGELGAFLAREAAAATPPPSPPTTGRQRWPAQQRTAHSTTSTCRHRGRLMSAMCRHDPGDGAVVEEGTYSTSLEENPCPHRPCCRRRTPPRRAPRPIPASPSSGCSVT